MQSRVDLLKYLIQRYNFKSYLEIGCWNNHTFNQIPCTRKVGVDPISGGTHRMTSDAFFEKHNHEKFDLIFIDGLHWCEQVFRDVSYGLKFLNPNGIIVLHDSSPPTPEHAVYPFPGPEVNREWSGDVWKIVVFFRQVPNLDIVVSDFDWGCAIVRPLDNTNQISIRTWYSKLEFQGLANNRKVWLRVCSSDEIIKWLDMNDSKHNIPHSNPVIKEHYVDAVTEKYQKYMIKR